MRPGSVREPRGGGSCTFGAVARRASIGPYQLASPLPRDGRRSARAMLSTAQRHLATTPAETFVAARIVRARLHARHALRRRSCPFSYDGRQLEAVHARYNRTWLNERQLELAVAFDFLARTAGWRGRASRSATSCRTTGRSIT